MRGSLLLEIVLAVSLASIVITGIALDVFGLPLQIRALVQREEALEWARASLHEMYEKTTANPSALSSIGSGSDGIYARSLSLAETDDTAVTKAVARVEWKDPQGIERSISLESALSDFSDTSNPCDDFISGDWAHPRTVASYTLSPTAFGNAFPNDSYRVSALAATPSAIIAAIGSTTNAASPTILLFRAHGTSPLLSFEGGFDNASTSKVGISSLSLDRNYAFAGNAFASKSAQTCSDRISCAQIHVFTGVTLGRFQRISALTLSTSSPPYAIISSGEGAPAASLSYSHEYLYVGLQKTSGGDEFNVIDAHDPANLRWISGIPIGRTVSSITIRNSIAYISTDDPSRELVIIDVSNPSAPQLLGSYDAPGAVGFGYGSVSLARNGLMRFGRTYSSNGPELQLLDIHTPSFITSLQDIDEGTSKDPESLRSLLGQDTLTFALLTHRLEFWSTANERRISPFAPSYTLPAGSTGASLACRDSLLYVARNTISGGIIDVITGS